MIRVVLRRKPVPAEFRDQHILRTHSQIAGGGWGGWSRTYRCGGTCSCGGASFGLDADDHTMVYAEVLDAWKDHVAEACHGEDYYTRKEIEV